MRRVLARSLLKRSARSRCAILRPFVDRWHEIAAAPPRRPASRNPNIAVLTPGPLSATYFEHVYLSRLLGVPLVEAATWWRATARCRSRPWPACVRSTLLRRLDSAFADPLELRADSALGITGLVETTRTGRIALANALGSGLAETPALVPFLDRLSQHLLGASSSCRRSTCGGWASRRRSPSPWPTST